MRRPMARHQEPLFDPGPRHPKPTARLDHLRALDKPLPQDRLPGGSQLVPAMADGLVARLVKPHSAEKARMVSADLGTVGRAMRRQWFDVSYFELFSGPGLLIDDVTGEEVAGSPLQALAIQSPFDNYVFSDDMPLCADALNKRIGSRPNVRVLCGDANDFEHLERICALIDPRDLVIAYLDPAKPNLYFETVAYLARRFRFIDFIINLPFSGIHRSLAVGGCDRPALMLNHPRPQKLIHADPGRTAQNIRDHYDAQLRNIGFEHIARRCVNTTRTNSPLYDIVLASRHPRAVELWEKANRLPKSAQLGLGGEL
ncbi:MAG: three-Cys-motif partner protein TcmP [Thermoleophilaceae bacterium]